MLSRQCYIEKPKENVVAEWGTECNPSYVPVEWLLFPPPI